MLQGVLYPSVELNEVNEMATILRVYVKKGVSLARHQHLGVERSGVETTYLSKEGVSTENGRINVDPVRLNHTSTTMYYYTEYGAQYNTRL